MSMEIFEVCDALRPEVIKMVYTGPANTPIDMQYMYQNTSCEGYIGGSVFDRIPVEHAIPNMTRAFKTKGSLDANDPLLKLSEEHRNIRDYVKFIKEYVEENYEKEIQLRDLAAIIHVSVSYLSVCFKKEMGIPFTEYLVRYRMNKARELLSEGNISCKEVAWQVGYEDYSQFSKMFKKYIGCSPTKMLKDNINTSKLKIKPKNT